MKTKIFAAVIVLFVMACGSQKKADSTKMILKASTNMYVVVSSDSTLVANEPDAAKAMVFEKVKLPNGKWNLKTSKGRFIVDDRSSGNKLYANRGTAGEWEEFEIIRTGESKINLKSSAGKVVCADQSMGNVLIANREQMGEWETFTFEPK